MTETGRVPSGTSVPARGTPLLLPVQPASTTRMTSPMGGWTVGLGSGSWVGGAGGAALGAGLGRATGAGAGGTGCAVTFGGRVSGTGSVGPGRAGGAKGGGAAGAATTGPAPTTAPLFGTTNSATRITVTEITNGS